MSPAIVMAFLQGTLSRHDAERAPYTTYQFSQMHTVRTTLHGALAEVESVNVHPHRVQIGGSPGARFSPDRLRTKPRRCVSFAGTASPPSSTSTWRPRQRWWSPRRVALSWCTHPRRPWTGCSQRWPGFWAPLPTTLWQVRHPCLALARLCRTILLAAISCMTRTLWTLADKIVTIAQPPPPTPQP